MPSVWGRMLFNRGTFLAATDCLLALGCLLLVCNQILHEHFAPRNFVDSQTSAHLKFNS